MNAQKSIELPALIELGNEIKRIRQAQGLTQDELARNAGWSRTTLSRLEQGEPQGDIGFQKLQRLLSLLKIQLVPEELAYSHHPIAEDLIRRRDLQRGFSTKTKKLTKSKYWSSS